MTDGTIRKLSEDVVISIFFRLPVKSLSRLKCVTKSWHALIKSFNFINLHLNRTTTTKDEFILFKRSLKEPKGFKNILSFLLNADGEDDMDPVSPDLDVPYLPTSYGSIFHQLTGPCNGLIVLTDSINFVLLNPATRNYRLLPPSPFVCPRGFYRSIGGVGFGYDSGKKKYKVIRIAEVYGEPPFNDPSVVEWKGEVYDSSTDSWRELADVDQELPWPYTFPFSEMLFKGAFHWYAHRNMVVILCFDISTEVFRTMQVPETCALYDEKCHSLAVLDKSLTFICYPDQRRESSPIQETIDIWIMGEYSVNESWIKKRTIRSPPIESPLAVWKDRLLLLQDKSGLLISYDLDSDAVKEFKLDGYPGSLRVIVYNESLIPLPIGSTQVQIF
ncbi:PREDICTED: F-box protein CPR30-like [Nicotiana attenuata]|uniref:F-box protein cpr30 n=1 Tax=Nicotiana attenuata TaxID=49451 RepID=A0A1J6KV82_NICAT|nr:PREDICTED: F-box protein CPR30-like [Nicotiana attenuata]OIT26667.1 f-box protein cpr30 [Nicotiana attenuata]QCF41902.1 SLF-like-4 protein [Nicotiana attenuata]